MRIAEFSEYVIPFIYSDDLFKTFASSQNQVNFITHLLYLNLRTVFGTDSVAHLSTDRNFYFAISLKWEINIYGLNP